MTTANPTCAAKVTVAVIRPGEPGYLHEGTDSRYWCESTAPRPYGGDYTCTRVRGHDGDHDAHGVNDKLCATWPNARAEATRLHAEAYAAMAAALREYGSCGTISTSRFQVALALHERAELARKGAGE